MSALELQAIEPMAPDSKQALQVQTSGLSFSAILVTLRFKPRHDPSAYFLNKV